MTNTATVELLTYYTCIYSSAIELGIQYISTDAAIRLSHSWYVSMLKSSIFTAV